MSPFTFDWGELGMLQGSFLLRWYRLRIMARKRRRRREDYLLDFIV